MKTEKISKQGFTLIEMLVVVLIVGILAAIALPQYQNAVEKSKASEALVFLKSYREQQSLCYSQKEDYFCSCSHDSGVNIFNYAGILEGPSDPDCDDSVCGPTTKDFTYSCDGQDIFANRLPYGTKYYLSVTGHPKYDNRISCSNESDKNYCKIIGFTKQEGNTWYQP